MKATTVITANQGIRGGKIIPLRKTIKEALSDGQCPSVKNVFCMKRTESDDFIETSDIILDEKTMTNTSNTCPPEMMNSEDPLFILYTSGSTGKPKGLVHSSAGYLTYAGFTQKQAFDYFDPNDVFGCVADIGWITGKHVFISTI
jgi:acetyl-CoA synthetase